MEKASKKASEVEVTFVNGTKKMLGTIPEGDVVGLKFDGKLKKDSNGKEIPGTETSFTLKRGFEKEESDVYYERRLFQNADMDNGVCYVLPLGLTIPACNRLDGESANVDYIATAKRIKVDGEKAGKGQGDPIARLVKKANKGEKLSETEKLILGTWFAGMTKVEKEFTKKK